MKTVITMAVVILVWTTALQADENRRDGNWWQSQTRIGKLNYITGFFDGMDLGHNFSYWKSAAKEDYHSVTNSRASFIEYSNKYFAQVTSGQLADGIDNLYADFRNRGIAVPDGVWLVVNAISGKSEEEMKTMIENWRKNANPQLPQSDKQ